MRSAARSCSSTAKKPTPAISAGTPMPPCWRATQTPENKELFIIPGAVHTDLYDNLAVIPFDKIEAFFRQAMA